MKHVLLIAALALFSPAFAQPQEQPPQETARAFLRSGDFDNAILVLNKAIQQDPNNLELQKDLGLAYYYKRDFARALTQVEAMLDRDDADVNVYQLAGNVYRALEQTKDADRLYKKALKKFPKSGPLHSEYGEFLATRKESDAIQYWEKGIEADPSYSGNYYHAARYYANTKDRVWTLIYAEIFLNMENLTERSTDIKKLLYDTYREKLFDPETLGAADKSKNDFARAVLQTYAKQSSLSGRTLNTEVLTMIRTRFVLDWFTTNAGRFPFRLFDYHQQLIREGMFDAYNQWLFGTTESLPAFDQWTRNHAEAYNKFVTFQKGRVFKMPAGQYYGPK